MSKATLQEVMFDWLQANGFDGLYQEDDCCCLLNDFMPCDQPQTNCIPGYKWTAEQWKAFGGSEPYGDGWTMWTEKPKEAKNAE